MKSTLFFVLCLTLGVLSLGRTSIGHELFATTPTDCSQVQSILAMLKRPGPGPVHRGLRIIACYHNQLPDTDTRALASVITPPPLHLSRTLHTATVTRLEAHLAAIWAASDFGK